MKNPIKMDDLGVPLFLETPIYFNGVLQTCPFSSFYLLASGFGSIPAPNAGCETYSEKSPPKLPLPSGESIPRRNLQKGAAVILQYSEH